MSLHTVILLFFFLQGVSIEWCEIKIRPHHLQIAILLSWNVKNMTFILRKSAMELALFAKHIVKFFNID